MIATTKWEESGILFFLLADRFACTSFSGSRRQETPGLEAKVLISHVTIGNISIMIPLFHMLPKSHRHHRWIQMKVVQALRCVSAENPQAYKMPIFNKAQASCLNFAPVGCIIFIILDSKQNYLLLCNKTFLSVPWLFAIQIPLKRDSCTKLISASACKMCKNPRDP